MKYFCLNKKLVLKEILFMRIKSFLILGGVSIIFTLYFVLIGFLEDKEAFKFGVPLLGITVLMICLVFSNSIKTKKDINKLFSKFNNKDLINFSFEKNENEFSVVCLENNERFNFYMQNVGKIVYTKNYIVLLFNNRQTLILGNDLGVLDLLSNANK